MKVILVKTLVCPHLNYYCDVVMSGFTVELSDRLHCGQNKYCNRFIFSLRKRDYVSPFFEQLPVLKLSKLLLNTITLSYWINL